MKIYSWNILFENKRFDDALAFIIKLSWDVIALQEVPEEFLAALKTLPFHIAYGPDTRRIRTKEAGRRTDYLVILSKHPLRSVEVIPFPDEWYAKPIYLRTRFMAKLMGWHQAYADKSALRVEIEVREGTVVQLFCAHLAIVFSTKTHRLREFEYLMERRDAALPTIFCADTNILELPHITLLNWLAGGPLEHWVLWWRERSEFNTLFKHYGLKNPLAGGLTHWIALSQLDHIVVSESLPVISKAILQHKPGSDHHPVMVEVEV
ncbi:MAG TPA: endonuclease/exonuclease/phosphatase family protein [Candidatus Paceibacterota bacterium]